MSTISNHSFSTLLGRIVWIGIAIVIVTPFTLGLLYGLVIRPLL